MNNSLLSTLTARFSLGLLLLAAGLSPALAQDTSTNAIGRTFASPEDAVRALGVAANAGDTNALADLFGPDFKDIQASDPVQGQNELNTFAKSFSASNHLEYAGDTNCVLETGADRWPFPIPIVRDGSAWHFDTLAGEDEILNRRIGNNELMALQSLRTAAEAQREYAATDHNGDDVLEFAQKMISTPGQKDGLYWSPDLDGEVSPLGPAFVTAQNEGYHVSNPGDAPQPFHGYFFKILMRQGKHAPGGAYDYLINGHMIGGFAFVAWPAQYSESGIMTFIINQRGKIYQKDLGPDTERKAGKMKTYDPDSSWVLSPN